MLLMPILDEYKFTLIFYSIVILILFLNRKKFEIHGILGFYKSKFGINLIEKIANKFREWIKLFGYCGIGIGFIAMIIGAWNLFESVWILIFDKIEIPAGSPIVLPGVPLAGLGIVFPLVIGWITIITVMIVHEFSHGIVAKAHNLNIKSTGIAFFGPILGAFVELDEKELAKRSDIEQYSIMSAGPVSNFVLSLFAIAIIFLIISPLSGLVSADPFLEVSTHTGFPAYDAGIENGSIIMKVNDQNITNTNVLVNTLNQMSPGEMVKITTDKGEFDINMTSHPNNPDIGYLGIFISQKTLPKEGYSIHHEILSWFNELFYWIGLISFLVGLFNVLPLFITDGGRMVKVASEKLVKDKKKALTVWKNINFAFLFIVLMIVLVMIMKMFI